MSHAHSMRSVIRRWLAPCFLISSLTAAILSAVSMPALLSGSSHALVGFISGLSFQTSPPRSLPVEKEALQPASSSFSFSLFVNPDGTTLPSKPITKPSFFSASASRNSSIAGTPSSPIFMSSMPLPSSCLDACRKYLPSVQSHAPSAVTSRSPADPVNPLKNARVLKNALTYSDP